MAQDPGKLRQDRAIRADARVAFVVSSFHEELTGAMLESARRELRAAGLADEAMPVAWVPGSFELPLAARRFARDARIDAVICLGLVLKGETSHDLHVARGAVDGIRQVMLASDKPVLLGVLTCETLEQARDRALPPDQGGKQDKGRELARAALEVLAALDEIDAQSTAARTVGFPHPPASTTGEREAGAPTRTATDLPPTPPEGDVKKRTRARELALQFLYQHDLVSQPLEECDGFLRSEERDVETRRFAKRLVAGTLEHKAEIDEMIQGVAQNWNISRMAVVDRNVLRLATHELLHCRDIPPKVAINEAIEIGKRYSTQNSGAFINGILDKIMNRKTAGAAGATEAAKPAEPEEEA